jgi:hypothetical protein
MSIGKWWKFMNEEGFEAGKRKGGKEGAFGSHRRLAGGWPIRIESRFFAAPLPGAGRVSFRLARRLLRHIESLNTCIASL